MLDKLFSHKHKLTSLPDEKTEGFVMVSEEDMLRYQFQNLLFQKVFETEAVLHNEEDPTTIATTVMKAACEFYDADWCGILIADLQTQAFFPEIWYETGLGPMKDTLFKDIEFTEEFATWAQHLIDQEPMIIPDAEAIREVSPKEYEAYKRLDARSIMGVPFGLHPLGFMVIRNLKRYSDRTEPLQLACFVAMMMLEQIRRKRLEEITHSDDEDDGKLHIRCNILGPHNVTVKGRTIYEKDLKHPNRRAWVVMLYLIFHQKPVNQYHLITENWPDEEEEACRNALRKALSRMNNDLAAYNDTKMIVLNNGLIDFSDQVVISTDAEEMEGLYEKTKHLPDGEDKISILKKAFNLYRDRLFIDGESACGSWLMTYSIHYNQVFVDITTDLLKALGHQKDFRCIMDYAPMALEKEPGMQAAYYWMILAAEGMGNSIGRDKTLQRAKTELSFEEFSRLEKLLEATGHSTA